MLQLRGVTYEWRDADRNTSHRGTETGFLAQEVEKVFPEFVGTNSEGWKTLSLPPPAVTALTVESLRELKAENDRLAASNRELLARLTSMDGRLGRIERASSGRLTSAGMTDRLPIDAALVGCAALLLSARRRRRPQEQ